MHYDHEYCLNQKENFMQGAKKVSFTAGQAVASMY